jgi:hypothetical protein
MTGMYAASSHGMLGVARSVTPDLERLGAKTCLIQLPVSGIPNTFMPYLPKI